MGANEETLICRLISIPVLPSETLAPTEVSCKIITTSVAKQTLRVGAMCQSYITISAVPISGFNCGTQIQILKPNLCLRFFFFLHERIIQDPKETE